MDIGKIIGLILSVSATDPQGIVVAPGAARDVANQLDITASAPVAISLSSNLDVGTVKPSKDYHIHLLACAAGPQVIFSRSAHNPVMPTGCTNRRRLGSVLTDANSHIKPFKQTGDRFDLAPPTFDIQGSPPALTLQQMAMPRGVKLGLIAYVYGYNSNGSSSSQGIVSLDDPDAWIPTPNVSGQDYTASYIAGPGQGFGLTAPTMSDANGRVYTWIYQTAGAAGVNVFNHGWIDDRGQHDAGPTTMVAAFGTSLSANGPGSGNWLPSLAVRLTATSAVPFVVRDFGVPGAYSSTLLTGGQLQAVIDERPQIVTIEADMNDAISTSGISVAQSDANIRSMISQLQAAIPGVQIVQMVMNPVAGAQITNRPNLTSYYAADRSRAAQLGLPLVDLYNVYGTPPLPITDYKGQDGVHLIDSLGMSVTAPTVGAVIAPML